jgi:glycosyltransferase involved in cell wall biosynthesis
MISIIITYYDPRLKKTGMFADLIRSIGENSQGLQEEIEMVIVSNANSYVEAVNAGLSRAKGDYLVVLNDDIVIEDSQWLSKLCVPEGIASCRLGTFHMTGAKLPDATCFAMSRATFEKLGLMDERYKDGINYEDTDYFLTAKKLDIPFIDAEIKMKNIGGQTFTTYFGDVMSAKSSHNRQLFNDKWGR